MLPFFYKYYSKCFLATALSFIGSFCGAMAVVALIQVVIGRGDFSGKDGVITIVVCGALFFVLRKLADVAATRKYKKLTAQEAAGSDERR